MKRAGILLIVLAVLAISWMAAANIVVADTGDEAHYESTLLSGSREGGEGVRISGYGCRYTVNDPDMYFNLDYDAGSGTSESTFRLGSQDSEIGTDYGTYNFDIFDGLNSGGSSSGGDGMDKDDLPLPCAAIADETAAGQTYTETMYLSELCEYWPITIDRWGRQETEERFNAICEQLRLRLPVPEDTLVRASVTKDEGGHIREYDCNVIGGSSYELRTYNYISCCIITVELYSRGEDGEYLWQSGQIYSLETEPDEELKEYVPVPESFRLALEGFEVYDIVEVPGVGGVLLLERGDTALRIVQLSCAGEILQDLELPRSEEDVGASFVTGEDWALVEQHGLVHSLVPDADGVYVAGPVYDLRDTVGYASDIWSYGEHFYFDGERLASLIEVRFRWFGNPIYQDDSFPDEPRDALLYLAVATPEEVLLSEELYPTLYNNGLNLWYTIEME